MRMTLNRRTALYITRFIRSCGIPGGRMKRTDLIAPDPAPRKRWTQSAIDLSCVGITDPFGETLPLDVAVSSMADRVRMKHAFSTLYASEQKLPRRSFIEVAPGVAISCPELLFIEMGTVLDLPEHLMLGHELCGGFSRDASDPLNGPVRLHCKPVTSSEKIRKYLAQTKWLQGARQARRVLELLSDNAWSPTESVVATMASLPVEEFGYGLAPCVLNKRIETPEELVPVTEAGARKPDILFGEAHVGINYDGAVHLDLDAIVRAARDAERHPDEAEAEFWLDGVVQEVRAKAVDDIKRNRELAAAGYVVFPVVKEDLYNEGGLDRVMLQVCEALETFAGWDMSAQRRAMRSKFMSAKRQELAWSLLAGKHRSYVSSRKEAFPYLFKEGKKVEIMIGF